MSKKTLYLLGILVTIVLGCIIHYYSCCENCADMKEVNNTEVLKEDVYKIPEATYNSFKIQDNSSGLQFSDNDNFKFQNSDYKIADSIGDNLDAQIERLSEYLNSNPNKNIQITGLYRSNEDNSSVFPNLGVARANSVKNYFISYGISPKSLKTKGLLDDMIIPDSTKIFHGPLRFDVNMVKAGKAGDGKAIKDNLNTHPLVLQFNTGSNSLTLNKEQRQKIVDLLNYVESYDGKLLVTGHTDNTGIRENNIKLSLQRAEFVKNNLSSNGINSAYIMTDSKGPDQPIADNETEKGRAENRRVEVKIN